MSLQLTTGEKSTKVVLYSGADDPDLPARIKALPSTIRSRWVNNYNYTVVDTQDQAAAEHSADCYTTISVDDMVSMAMLKSALPALLSPSANVVQAPQVPQVPVPTAASVAAVQPGFVARLKAWLGADDVVNGESPSNSAVQPALKHGFTVYKGADGRTRTLLVYSNVFKDSHKEILSTAAHKEYAEAAEAGQALYPDLHIWHGGPATKWGTVETVSFVDGFAIAGGVVDAGKEHVALKLKELSDQGELAVSFGFYGLRGPDGVYHLYRPFEISPLPVGSEANPWTSIDFAGNNKENDMAWSDKKKVWFKEHFGMDDAALVTAEKMFGDMSAALKAVGVEYKEDESQIAPVTPPAPPAPVAPAPAPADAGLLPQIQAMAKAVEGLAGAVKTLQDDVAAAKKQDATTVEQRAQEQVLAKIAGAGAGFSPTQTSGNVQVGAKQDEDDWFNQALSGVFTPQSDAVVGIGHANGEGS